MLTALPLSELAPRKCLVSEHFCHFTSHDVRSKHMRMPVCLLRAALHHRLGPRGGVVAWGWGWG